MPDRASATVTVESNGKSDTPFPIKKFLEPTLSLGRATAGAGVH
jgi:hypothetical protein